MAIAGGLSAQLGLKAETTVGTAVTPDRFFEFNSESLQQEIERIESGGLRPSRRVVSKRFAGRKGVGGDIELEITNKGQALLWKHILGSVATTTPASGTNSRDHLATVGALDGLGLTIQVGRTGTDGTTRAFTYAGCKVAAWELSGEADGIPVLSLTIDGMSETTATALATAAYPTGLEPLVFTQGTLSVGGSELLVKQFSLAGDNHLYTDRYYLTATNPGRKHEQIEGVGMREYTGSLTADFKDLTAYNLFVNKTQSSLAITYTSTTAIEGSLYYSLTVTVPAIEFDGETPTVGGAEIIEQSLPFKVIDTGNANGPVQVTVRSDDSTP